MATMWLSMKHVNNSGSGATGNIGNKVNREHR
jgi:hypothetical protein